MPTESNGLQVVGLDAYDETFHQVYKKAQFQERLLP